MLNHLNAELNLICHLLALLGAHHILHVSRIRVKVLGDRGSNSGEGEALQIVRSLVRFQMMSLEFFFDIIFPIALWPWGRLSL